MERRSPRLRVPQGDAVKTLEEAILSCAIKTPAKEMSDTELNVYLQSVEQFNVEIGESETAREFVAVLAHALAHSDEKRYEGTPMDFPRFCMAIHNALGYGIYLGVQMEKPE